MVAFTALNYVLLWAIYNYLTKCLSLQHNFEGLPKSKSIT